MKNKYCFILTLFLSSALFLFVSCEKSESFDSTILTPSLKLGDLNPGQSNRYQRFTFDRNGERFSERTFHQDTLLVEVLAEQNGQFIVAETITPQSEILKDPDENWPTKVLTNSWRVQSDSLYVESTEPNIYIHSSHLLFFRAEAFPISAYQEQLSASES